MYAAIRNPLVGYDSQTNSPPRWAPKATQTASRRGIADTATNGAATAHAITIARGMQIATQTTATGSTSGLAATEPRPIKRSMITETRSWAPVLEVSSAMPSSQGSAQQQV